MITVWPNARPLGWTGALARGRYLDLYGRPAPCFPPIPLRQALSRRWPTDAHFTPYVLTFDGKPGSTPRCNKSATEAIAGLGGALAFSCVVLDCDDPIAHETETDAREEWRRDFWRKFSRFDLPAGGYDTRGGARLVVELARPVGPEDYLTALSGLHAFAEDVGLVADRLIDLQRCYRLPFVTRDGKGQDRPHWLRFRAITGAEQSAVLAVGRAFPLVRTEEFFAPQATVPRVPGERMRAGDFLRDHVSWGEILEPHGGRFGGMSGSQELWYRPGKSGNGPASARTNYGGAGRLFVFSSNWAPFAAEASHDKLGALAVLEGVDLRGAARLAAKRWNI